MRRILSIDWDFFCGSREHVFDSPLWGSLDRDYERSERWQALAQKRGGTSFCILEEDFPLFGNPEQLGALKGFPCHVMVSHEHALDILKRNPEPCELFNFDAHHDLFSLSGDPKQVRPGNWVGHALSQGLIAKYACFYPFWHQDVRVSEGYDLDRTWEEIDGRCDAFSVELNRLSLETFCWHNPLGIDRVGPAKSTEVFLVQSPAWSNPLYDGVFWKWVTYLEAQIQSEPLWRSWK
ncbi:MAG: arginase [Deinococcaceae bacterium]